MLTTEKRVNFLMRDVRECGFTKRLRICLANDNLTNIFSVLFLSEAALNRTPNLGKVSIKEFSDYIAPYGFQLADADKISKSHKDIYVEEIGDKQTGENAEIVRAAATRFITELDAIRPPPIPSPSTLTDIQWIIPLLPENLRTGLTREFLISTLDSAAFKSSIETNIEAIRTAATAALDERLFARHKEWVQEP